MERTRLCSIRIRADRQIASHTSLRAQPCPVRKFGFPVRLAAGDGGTLPLREALRFACRALHTLPLVSVRDSLGAHDRAEGSAGAFQRGSFTIRSEDKTLKLNRRTRLSQPGQPHTAKLNSARGTFQI